MSKIPSPGSARGALPALRRTTNPTGVPSSLLPAHHLLSCATTTTAAATTTTSTGSNVASTFAASGASSSSRATPVCSHCGAAFTKATAKFCARCGTKKLSTSGGSNGEKNGRSTDDNGRRPSCKDGGNDSLLPPPPSQGRIKRKGSGSARDGGPPSPPHRSSASSTIPFTESNPRSAGKLTGSSQEKSTKRSRVSTAAAAATEAASGKGSDDRSTLRAAAAGTAAAPLLSGAAVGEAQLQAAREGSSSSTNTTSPHHHDVTALPDEDNQARNSAGPASATSTTANNTALPVRRTRSSRQSTDVDGASVNGGSSHGMRLEVTATTTTLGSVGTSGSMATLEVSSEEEAKYTAWSTLGPDGLTPDMLQTQNAPTELLGWRKGSLIGRGTYGSVYLGLLTDGSFYAVKCVELGGKHAADMKFNASELVSLSREINMMQRLRHRNLCTFKGVLYEAETTSICMFMEYVGGGSLSSIVKRFKPLPAPVVRRWTRQLLSGLLYLHSQHIIHRDIKGDNVLVDTNADPNTEAQVKLADFGAARRLTDAVSQSRTTIGTPYWMAPEVVDVTGEGKGYSYKADVWSVGCTVAEMLTGRPPWPARSSAPAVIMMVAAAEGMPTEIPKQDATPGCYDFMVKCFTRIPEQRPTVEELLQHPWILGEME